MTAYYVRSLAAGAGTGADWTNAYTTLTTAFSGKAAGDVFYVSEDHAESTAGAVTLSNPGTAASPCFIYCVDHTGTVPPVSADLRTTAQVITTANNILSTTSGISYWYGIIFSSGNGANSVNLAVGNANAAFQIFDSCALRLGGTSGGTLVLGRNGALNGRIVLSNTTVQVAATGSVVLPGGSTTVWRNTTSAITGATLPTTLFSNTACGSTLIQGVDLSALGSGKTIVPAQSNSGQYTFVDCKLGTSVTIAATPTSPLGFVDVVRADSGAVNYRDERYWYYGSQIVETGIVRTGGASDGVTPISWKLTATANSKWVFPFEAQLITIWNDRTTPITTLTIYGTTTGGGVPNNDDIWVEVEYLGSSLTPQGSFITTTKADNLAASVTTNNSADASTWGGGGAGNGFKMVVPSFTPQMAGPFNIIVHVAAVSATYYVDPKPVIT